MAAILRKTAAGQAEVGSKAHPLPPRARSLLIMIDGKRSLDELRAMLGPQVDEAVLLLQREGLVEPVPGAAAPVTAAAATPVAAAFVPVAAALDVAAVRRDAARAITDALGPMGDALAMRVERAKTEEELRAVLQLAAKSLADAAPRAKAEAFRQRFLPGA